MGRPVTRLNEGRSSTLRDFVLELKSCCILSVLLSVPGKTMLLLLFSCMMMIFCLQPGSSEDLLTPFKDDQLDLEGNDVTLSCNYSGTVNLLLWYRQTSSSSPQLVTSGYSDTTGRLSLRHEKTKTTFHLLISSAAVTDSAVYYCALQPNTGGGYKIYFGTGTSLTIETKEPIEPDYYDLGPNGDGTRVCLATGFTRLKATLMKPGFQNQSASQITGHNGEPTGFYSQVAFQKDGEKCENEEQGEGNITKPDQCDAELEPDEMVNLASITIFGLRIIFIKTVAFNVLMTLRLWTSQ